MLRKLVMPVTIGLTFLIVVSPATAFAQQTSGIAGAVRDTSGAVLPGVTVEAASPALIEKLRIVVTDGEGRYNVVELRPGTYTVTFTLPGFATFRREGIVLTSGFTATVNADLQVSTVEETITVTGATPLVDTQNVRRQTVVSDELLDVLPTSTKQLNSVVALTLGLGGIADVSGIFATQVGTGTFHGKSSARTQFDGMSVENTNGGGVTGYIANAALVQEITLQSSGISAEGNAEGALINMIPKEGGNTFLGTLSGAYTNESLAGDNLNDDLRARGLTTVNKVLKIYDGTFTLGGPIKRDRLWFFTAHREWGSDAQFAGVFWNKTQGTPFYTPDLDRPGTRPQWFESHAGRLTWQATTINKFSFLADVQDACVCRSGTIVNTGIAPEAILGFHYRPNGIYQASWNAPLTNRILLEGTFLAMVNHWPQFRQPGVEPDHISILEQSTGVRYNSRETYDAGPNDYSRGGQRFSVSYVTGSHTLKFGVQDEQGTNSTGRISSTSNLSYTLNLGVPVSLTQYATPYTIDNRLRHDLGVYAQDQWAIGRLTLNLGVRFDHLNSYVPEQRVPATPNGWLPERRFDKVEAVPSWTDLSPRLGAAYDLFGTGRTALKVSLGRYVKKVAMQFAQQANPIVTSVNQVSRAWTDANGNYVPDCDLGSRAANGECGPFQNQNFGSLQVTTRFSDDVVKGFGVRPFNWDVSAEVQQQIGGSMSVTAGYYRNWYGNFTVTDNLLVGPGDFSPYSVTAPSDPRLPGGGGYQISSLYDINPDKFGQANNLVRLASDFGDQKQVSDFVTLSFDARLPSGARVGGGIDTGRTVTENCFVVDSPQQLVNCRVAPPLSANTQIKVNGSVPLPGEIFVSAVYQNLAGPEITAPLAVATAAIAPSLGRNLAGGARTATVPLVAPQTMYDDRTTRLDLRVGKNVRVTQRISVQGNVDLYNVFNSGSVLALTNNYGARWQVPTLLLDPRILQFSARVSF